MDILAELVLRGEKMKEDSQQIIIDVHPNSQKILQNKHF